MIRKPNFRAIPVVVVLPIVAACGGGGGSGPASRTATAQRQAHETPGSACAAPRSRHSLQPASATNASSSGIALARQDGRTLALIADEDDKAIHVVDVASRREIALAPVGGSPAHVLVASDGRVLVTLRDTAKVEVLAAHETEGAGVLTSRCSVATPAEPYALAETADGSRFVLTSGWGHALDVLAHDDLTRTARIDLPREPRGVIMANDHEAIVSHLIGSTMSVVDLSSGAVRAIDTHGPGEQRRINVRRPVPPPREALKARENSAGISKPTPPQAFETTQRDALIRRVSNQGVALAMIQRQVVNPRVLVDPGEADEVATYYGSAERPAEVADVMILDDKLTPFAAASTPTNRRLPRRDDESSCLLPRAIVENTADHTALVACLGSNTLLEYALDRSEGSPQAVVRGRWPVAAGPIAVAYDASRAQAIVWSQYDHAVSFVALPSGSIDERLVPEKARVARLGLARAANLQDGSEIELGRALYHLTGDRRISREGLACASCHPDGRDDALTWSTQDGPRQAPMLAGRLEGTGPYAWSGTSDRVAEHLEHTMTRLGGTGLAKREMEALAAYCLSMKTYTTPASDPMIVARGKQIFESSEAQCATCHSGAVLTDQKHHDVGSKAFADGETMFDTPSLRFVGGTAPYFHDGRYASLRQLLTARDTKMGQTSHLSDSDLDALEAYLRTL